MKTKNTLRMNQFSDKELIALVDRGITPDASGLLPSHGCVRAWIPLLDYARLVVQGAKKNRSLTDHTASVLSSLVEADRCSGPIDAELESQPDAHPVVEDGRTRVNVSLDLLAVVTKMLETWDTRTDG